jgi:hypothetical protein
MSCTQRISTSSEAGIVLPEHQDRRRSVGPVVVIVLSHRDAHLVRRLIGRLRQGENVLVISHHDPVSEPLGLSPASDLVVVPDPVHCPWGRIQAVQTVWRCLRWIHRHVPEASWVLLVSGQDYPTRHMRDITAALRTTTADAFVHHRLLSGPPSQDYDDWQPLARRRYLNKHRLPGSHMAVPLPRWHHPFHDGLDLFGGSSWINVNRRALDHLVESEALAQRLLGFLRWSANPDEAFVHTLLLNGGGDLDVVNDDRRFIRWHGQLPHPPMITAADVPAIRASDAFFARKLRSQDEETLDLLDAIAIDPTQTVRAVERTEWRIRGLEGSPGPGPRRREPAHGQARLEHEAQLGNLVEQLWGSVAQGSIVVTKDGKQPAGYRMVEQYLVAPSMQRARFLVPLTAGPAPAQTAVVHYNKVRHPPLRAARSMLALSLRLNVGQRLLPDRLGVWLDRTVTPHEATDLLLQELLRDLLGVPDLVMAIGTRPPDPQHKPTLHLIDGAGRSVAFAKVGWNDITRLRVAHEAEVLAEIRDGTLPALHSPRLLADIKWSERRIAVVAPLPDSVQRVKASNPWSTVAAIRAVSETGNHRITELGGSSYWAALEARVDRTGTIGQEMAEPLHLLAKRILATRGTQSCAFGAWHGDWVPWNLGWDGDNLWAWDWEHYSTDVPRGFDLLHWAFQTNVTLRHMSIAAAVDRLLVAGPRLLARADLYQPVGGALVPLYLMEMTLRELEAVQLTGKLDDGLHRDGVQPIITSLLQRISSR